MHNIHQILAYSSSTECSNMSLLEKLILNVQLRAENATIDVSLTDHLVHFFIRELLLKMQKYHSNSSKFNQFDDVARHLKVWDGLDMQH